MLIEKLKNKVNWNKWRHLPTFIKELYVCYKTGRARACGNKINYKSFETAKKKATQLSKKWETKMDYYPCLWCRGWHIGHAYGEKKNDKRYNQLVKGENEKS